MLPSFRYLPVQQAWKENWHDTTVEGELRVLNNPDMVEFCNLIIPHLPSRGRVLEAGCGLGKFVYWFYNRGFEVVGLDYIRGGLERLLPFGFAGALCVGTVERLPFHDEIFDVYFSGGVLEHIIEGPAHALRDAHRVLRSEGRLVMALPIVTPLLRVASLSPVAFLKRQSIIRWVFRRPPLACEFFEYYFTVGEIHRLLRDSGFRLIHASPFQHRLAFFTHLPRLGTACDTVGYDLKPTGEWLCRLFKRLSPWIAPYSLLIIAEPE